MPQEVVWKWLCSVVWVGRVYVNRWTKCPRNIHNKRSIGFWNTLNSQHVGLYGGPMFFGLVSSVAQNARPKKHPWKNKRNKEVSDFVGIRYTVYYTLKTNHVQLPLHFMPGDAWRYNISQHSLSVLSKRSNLLSSKLATWYHMITGHQMSTNTSQTNPHSPN